MVCILTSPKLCISAEWFAFCVPQGSAFLLNGSLCVPENDVFLVARSLGRKLLTLEALAPPSPSLRSGQLSGAQVSQPQVTERIGHPLLRAGVQDARRHQSELL